MYGEVFVFGSKIFNFDKEAERDALTALPLELSWKIFTYLDDASLKIAFKTHKMWARIIAANRNLQSRLNTYDLSTILGSRRMADFYKMNKNRLKRERKKRNYVLRGESVHETSKTTWQLKRSGGDIIVHTKRFKLF